MERLETRRLILRALSLDDAEDMFEYASLDDVGPQAGWQSHKTLQETKAIITTLAASNQVWAIEHKTTHSMIGTVGMHISADSEYPILGIVLSPAHQHQGLALEACEAIIKCTFATIPTEFLSAFVYAYNTPSIRLLSKLGFVNTKKDRNLIDESLNEIIQLELALNKNTFFKIKND